MSNELPSDPAKWPRETIPPALMAWARRTINLEEIEAGIREIEETGGYQLEDFIHEIEEKVKSRDRIA